MTPRTPTTRKTGTIKRTALQKGVRSIPAKADARIRHPFETVAERFQEAVRRKNPNIEEVATRIRVGPVVLAMLLHGTIEAPSDENERIRVMNWCYQNRPGLNG